MQCILLKYAITMELEGFSDASQATERAAIYCKLVPKSGQCCKLVISKSRILPLKQLSTPRLELYAVILLAKLIKGVISALKLHVNNIISWYNLMIVLSWIQRNHSNYKPFIVANGISTIQELTEGVQWQHVSSPFRGNYLNKLSLSELWWSDSLFQKRKDYPNRDIPTTVISKAVLKKIKKYNRSEFNNYISCFHCSINYFMPDKIAFKYCSKIIRTLEFIFRILSNCRKKKGRTSGWQRAGHYLLRSVP